MSLDVTDLTVTYGGQAALRSIDLTVETGQRYAVMGPSGAGKSTLLRVLAGLEAPTSGSILLNGNDITSSPSYERPVGLMFQDNALFPHMNVIDNVAYGLRMKGMPKDERTSRARDLLSLVSLSGFDDRMPTSLSGGEQQRVALARTLAPRPSLVLFDEPLGAIDQALKDDLMLELISIVGTVDATSIYVTHDRTEAEAFAESMAILREGRVERTGTPMGIWMDPRTSFVAGSIGHRNVVDGRALAIHSGPVVVPHGAVHVDPDGEHTATVLANTFRAGAYDLTIEVAGQRLVLPGRDCAYDDPALSIRIDATAIIPLRIDEI